MTDEPTSPDLKPATLILVWVLTGFSCTMVVARIITKVVRASGMAFEDYLMLVSMMLAIVFGVFTSLLCNLNLGQLWPGSEAYPAPLFARDLYVCHALGFMAPLFGRISFCLYMLRILHVTSLSTKFTMRALIILQLLVNLVMTVLVFTQCGSFRPLWENGLQPEASSCICHDVLKVIALSAVTFNALTDLYLTILPSVIVSNIQAMTARRRFGIAVVLGLSFFATIASICKIYYINVLYTTQNVLPVAERLIIVMSVEINIVIIAASLPILGPLFLHRFSRDPVKRIQTSPIYEVHVGKGPKRALINDRILPLPGSLSTRGSILNSDPVFSNTLPGIRIDSCHGQSLKVIKTVNVTLAPTEMTEDTILDGEIVPEDLQEHNSAEENIQTLPSESWDDIPTPPFLTDGQPGFKLE
ncbi:hypothetical protein KCU61_g7814, partial [Aureobasidium melanogenum]